MRQDSKSLKKSKSVSILGSLNRPLSRYTNTALPSLYKQLSIWGRMLTGSKANTGETIAEICSIKCLRKSNSFSTLGRQTDLLVAPMMKTFFFDPIPSISVRIWLMTRSAAPPASPTLPPRDLAIESWQEREWLIRRTNEVDESCFLPRKLRKRF